MNNNITVTEGYAPEITETVVRPLFSSGVSAGFPSPADDFIDKRLNLNEFLISNDAATFYLRVEGDSMRGSGIFSGDILIVDRSVKPQNSNVVIAVLDGELTVKRLRIMHGKFILEPDNPDYEPIEIYEGMHFEVWGVVTYVIHRL